MILRRGLASCNEVKVVKDVPVPWERSGAAQSSKGGGKGKGAKDSKRKNNAGPAEDKAAKLAKIECFKCGKMGHYSTHCPS